MKDLFKAFKKLTKVKTIKVAESSGISRQWIDEMIKNRPTKKSTKIALYHALKLHITTAIRERQQEINKLNDLLSQFEIELIEQHE